MDPLLWILIIAGAALAALFYVRHQRAVLARSIADSRAEARRWVERLGGQVYSLDPGDDSAARQALADAAERFTAGGSQVDQATSTQQYRLAQQTAYEGLYYVQAARISLGLDPGPDLPRIPGQQQAGAVLVARSVTVEGHHYEVSPRPGERTRHYYPGGLVAGRPVPQGWYSEPWWRSALDSGVWAVSSYLVASTLLFEGPGVSLACGHEPEGHGASQEVGGGDQAGEDVSSF